MFYTIRFNASFAALGIDPSKVPDQFRELGQVNGKRNGCTPQEAVILVLGELPKEYHMAADSRAAMVWLKERKIDVENSAIRLAFMKIGWDHLL